MKHLNPIRRPGGSDRGRLVANSELVLRSLVTAGAALQSLDELAGEELPAPARDRAANTNNFGRSRYIGIALNHAAAHAARATGAWPPANATTKTR